VAGCFSDASQVQCSVAMDSGWLHSSGWLSCSEQSTPRADIGEVMEARAGDAMAMLMKTKDLAKGPTYGQP
jgi:hypothetical protein